MIDSNLQRSEVKDQFKNTLNVLKFPYNEYKSPCMYHETTSIMPLRGLLTCLLKFCPCQGSGYSFQMVYLFEVKEYNEGLLVCVVTMYDPH